MEPTLLIVDDEPHLLRLLVRVFERAGYAVVSAADVDTAIVALQEHAARLVAVVLDVFVPAGGADVVLDALGVHGLEVGLVVVSGDVLAPHLAERVAGLGGRFLRKPFVPDALLDTVRAVIRPPTRHGPA